MDVVSFLFSAENLRTLFLFVAMLAGFVWLEKKQDRKLDALASSLRQEMAGIASSLRQEMAELRAELRQEMAGVAASLRQEMAELRAELRQEMDERFTAFHKTLKENDFAHLNNTIKALTFTLQKNGILESQDKTFVDSHLDGK